MKIYNSRGLFLVYSPGTGSGLVSLTLACMLSSQSTGVSLESTPGPSILATDLREFVTKITRTMVRSMLSSYISVSSWTHRTKSGCQSENLGRCRRQSRSVGLG